MISVAATISDLSATYAVRPLVVIDIHEKVAKDPGYHCSVGDIEAWEARHGTIPEGAVVMIRSLQTLPTPLRQGVDSLLLM